jgi:carbonic anhydrase
VHLVHQSEEGKLAVVGVLVQQGPAGTGLAEAWKHLPTQGENVALTDFDASALLPQDRTTFRYDGSLTTPPCTEGVQWLVMQHTVTAPAEAVAAFEKLVGDTARPLQPLNGRDPLIG